MIILKHSILKFVECCQKSLRGEVMASNGYNIKEENCKVNNLGLHLKKLV